MYCMYACPCVHVQDVCRRTLSNEFIIVGGVARESYGTRETSIRSSLHLGACPGKIESQTEESPLNLGGIELRKTFSTVNRTSNSVVPWKNSFES